MRKLSLKELNRLSNEEFKTIAKIPIVVVLDNIRSALNVGSVFRTSDAFALQGVYLCGITAQPPHREILKTAIGASQSVDWWYYESSLDCIQYLRKENYQILGVEQTDASVALQDFRIDTNQKYAVILGNEVKGVGDELIPLLDTCLEIPQFGTKHSLNVSVCTGIVLWDLVKQFRF